MNPGVHDIPAPTYHDDPCETPSLSASLAHILCTRSPWHAMTAHPRLNPDYKPREDPRFDVGTAAHAYFLEGKDSVVQVNFDDWRTKAAQEARDEAKAQGKIPLLAKTVDEFTTMLVALHKQLADHHAEPPLFNTGKAEQTLIWEEPGVICRARLDWLRDDRATIDDLKTTTRSASPDSYARALFGVGGDVQAAFYIRGVEELFGVTPAFRWVVIETTPPHALSVISPGPDILAIGQKKVEWAINRWRECLTTGSWPGYPQEICYAELPPFEEARWLEKETRAA